jgi:hypothetical protein
MRPNTVLLAFHSIDDIESPSSPSSSSSSSSSPQLSELVMANGVRRRRAVLPSETADTLQMLFSHHRTAERLSDDEYVGAIKDILFFKANIIITRKYVTHSTNQLTTLHLPRIDHLAIKRVRNDPVRNG